MRGSRLSPPPGLATRHESSWNLSTVLCSASAAPAQSRRQAHWRLRSPVAIRASTCRWMDAAKSPPDLEAQFEVPVEGRTGEVGARQQDISAVGYDGLGVRACVQGTLLVEPDEDSVALKAFGALSQPRLLCDSSTRPIRTHAAPRRRRESLRRKPPRRRRSCGSSGARRRRPPGPTRPMT